MSASDVPHFTPGGVSLIGLSPYAVLRVTDGIGHFDDTIIRRMKAFRTGMTCATANREDFNPNDDRQREFFRVVRERMAWPKSVTVPPDGYYLFRSGTILAFHPALPEDLDVSVRGGKALGTLLVAGLGLLFQSPDLVQVAVDAWQEAGNRVAAFFEEQIELAEELARAPADTSGLVRARKSQRAVFDEELPRAYAIMGVDATLSLREIRRVYLSKVKEIHPDRPTSEEVKLARTKLLQALNAAYDLIKLQRGDDDE